MELKLNATICNFTATMARQGYLDCLRGCLFARPAWTPLDCLGLVLARGGSAFDWLIFISQLAKVVPVQQALPAGGGHPSRLRTYCA